MLCRCSSSCWERAVRRGPTRQGNTRRCLDCGERFGPPRRGPWAERCQRCRMRRKWDLDPHHRLPEALRRAVIARDGCRCGICDRPIDPALRGSHPLAISIDHVVPIVADGGDALGIHHAAGAIAETSGSAQPGTRPPG